MSDIHNALQGEINRVAETLFSTKPILESTLKKIVINPEVRRLVGGFDTEYARWRGTFADKFFDMGTMIRLGTAVEICLRNYYMDRKGNSTLVELQSDPSYKKGIFQRVQQWHAADGAIALYEDKIGYELTSNPHLQAIQELMAHRHLYAHNSGLLDDDYIKNIEAITGTDLRAQPSLASSNYPAEDVYWFEPLERLDVFIEEARSFFRLFPS